MMPDEYEMDDAEDAEDDFDLDLGDEELDPSGYDENLEVSLSFTINALLFPGISTISS